jgi:23S rRNA pseudouridine2604 synthase
MTDPRTISQSVRLDKRVAALLACSRAQAQQYIEGGWVSVDGVVTETPQTMVSGERIEVSADARLEPSEPATLLVHKPAGVDFQASEALAKPASRSPDDDPELRMLKQHFLRLVPLVPLDAEASGLIVLSQDGRVRRRLTEDYASIEQEFVVEVTGTLLPYGLYKLAHGLKFQGHALPPCKVSWQNESHLRFAIKGVQPGQLRHMCREVGLDVVGIRRLRIGRIPLRKLPPGEWRYLPVGEKF